MLSYVLAEGGIRHTNFELHWGLFDRDTDTKIWKSSQKFYKNRRRRGPETLYYYSFIYSFTFRATAFSSIVRTGITLTPVTLTLKCVNAGASRIRMQAKSSGPHTV